jgi:mRNA interferase MazF
VTTLTRLLNEPDAGNGLSAPSRIMVDKVTAVRRSRLRTNVGVLDDASPLRLNRALVVFLGIASSR